MSIQLIACRSLALKSRRRGALLAGLLVGWVSMCPASPVTATESASADESRLAAPAAEADVVPSTLTSAQHAQESAGWKMLADVSGDTVRWSASRGAIDVGLSLQRRPLDGRAGAGFHQRFQTPFDAAELPTLSLGVRRLVADGTATPARLLDRVSRGDRPASYDSKVGIEWKPAESRVNFLREGLGMRLQGNDRMTLRLRKGRVGIYLLRKF